MSVAPQLLHGLRRWCRPCSLPHLHSQLPIEYSMNSSEEFSRKSLIGKTDLNTDWRPASSRSLGRRFICRKRSYDFFWISIRFGIGTVVLIFEKSMRSRYTFLGRLYIRHYLEEKTERLAETRRDAWFGIWDSRYHEPESRVPNPYLISTFAPTSSNFFLIASASSLGIA